MGGMAGRSKREGIYVHISVHIYIYVHIYMYIYIHITVPFLVEQKLTQSCKAIILQ